MLRNTWEYEVEVRIIEIKTVGCFGFFLIVFFLGGGVVVLESWDGEA